MSETIRHTICVSVLLTCGALVSACHSSSNKDQSAKTSSVKAIKETAVNETTHSRVARSQAPTVPAASTKATNAQRASHVQAQANAEAKTPSKSPGEPSNTASSGFASYGDGAAGAGTTDGSDSEKTTTGSTLPAGKQTRASR